MSATVAARPSPQTSAPGELRQILLEQLVESPWNPRKTFDPKKLAELADSLKSQGQLNPIVVRPTAGWGTKNGGQYEVGAGHRRLRAARKAGLPTLLAVVREMDDVAFLKLLTIENLQRDDVHELEEAEGYQLLMDRAKYDAAAIATEVGKSESYVYQRLKLLALIEPVRKAFRDGVLTAGHAILIARLQPKDQAEALKESRTYNGDPVPVRSLARWIEQNLHLDLHAAPWRKDDGTLLPIAGACTLCPKRTGFQPALFADIAKKDTCTDRRCYQAKQVAFLAGKLVELRAEHGKVATVSEEYGPSNRAWLSRSSYKEAKKGSCRSAQVALIMEGRRAGQQLYICADGNCKTHRERWERSSGLRSDKTQQAAEAARKRKLAAKATARRRAFDAIAAKVPGSLGSWELQFIARSMVKEMYHDALKRLCDAKGWTVSKSKYGGWRYDDAVAGEIRKLSGAPLVRLLFELAITADLEVAYWSSSGDRIREAGAHYRVNLAALERQAARELAKKKAAKTPAKKKAKR